MFGTAIFASRPGLLRASADALGGERPPVRRRRKRPRVVLSPGPFVQLPSFWTRSCLLWYESEGGQ